jgi:hypothetical protein
MSDIADWLTTHRNTALRLAQAVSLATTVEPELLRAARLELCPELSVEAETLIWFSPLVESRSPIAIVFKAEALAEIWKGLRGDLSWLNRIRSLTAKLHIGLAPTLLWEEEIVYWALSDRPESGEQITTMLRNIVKTMLDPQNSRLPSWAERALPRLPDRVRADESFRLLEQASFDVSTERYLHHYRAAAVGAAARDSGSHG